MALRIALMPVVAGISYEFIRLAGRSDNIIVAILSAPGMLIQRMTTKEPDESMVEVAITSVEAVFDWKNYLYETFGYEVDETWMDDAPRAAEDEAYDGEDAYDENDAYDESEAEYDELTDEEEVQESYNEADFEAKEGEDEEP